MDINEIQAYFEQNKDNEEVQNYIGGFITPDRVSQFLESEEGKKLIQPRLDGHFTKGLETFKQKTMPSLIDEEIRKRFPAKTESELQLEKIQKELADLKAEKTREINKNKALQIASSKKLPSDIIDFFVGEDETQTENNLKMLEDVINQHIETLVNERLKGSSYVPNDGKTNTITLESIKNMSQDEINKNWEAIQKLLQSKQG